MDRIFASIAFTPTIKAIQSRLGSRQKYADFEVKGAEPAGLSQREVEFIASCDSFYQATVSETGWPYVQHRGGAEGFLKVLDTNTLGYADFRGNQQYVSAGNLANNDGIALIMVDYPNRRRLKIMGHVHWVHLSDNPALFKRLVVPGYAGHIERGCIIRVEAWDWNCSKHITPRYTEQTIESRIAQYQQENSAQQNILNTL